MLELEIKTRFKMRLEMQTRWNDFEILCLK